MPTSATAKFWWRCAYAVANGSTSLTAPPTGRIASQRTALACMLSAISLLTSGPV
jgi:hypothetical protein